MDRPKDLQKFIERLESIQAEGKKKHLKRELIRYALSLTEEEWKKLKEEAKGLPKI